MATQTIAEIAQEAYKCFAILKREDGSEYLGLLEGSEQWIKDGVMAVDGNIDESYEEFQTALSMIAENEPECERDIDDMEDEISGDSYTSECLQWLMNDQGRIADADEAMKEMGLTEIIPAIQWAQVNWRREILRDAFKCCEEIYDGQDLDDDDEDEEDED